MKISKDEAEDFRLTIGLLLLVLDWTRKKLGAKAGIDEGALSRYCSGIQKAQPATWRKIEAATRIPLSAVRAHLPALRRLRSLAEDRSMPVHEAATIARIVGNAVESILRLEEPYLCGRAETGELPMSPPQAADRLQAEDLWVRLERWPRSTRLALVEEVPEFRSWALAERLCAESIQMAGDPQQALELAELALRVAERVTGESAWRSLLTGYVWAFLGNARRVASDNPGAMKAFSQAWELWDAGAAADTGLLDGSRLLDLEASLLRDQRHMVAALERLNQALALHPTGPGRGRILLNKGAVLEQMGSYEAAIETFQEAELWIDRVREPRWYFGLRFNLTACLCHLDRYEEAESALPELRALTAQPCRRSPESVGI
jgi:tetratricopeptide (TPR) repeat protein